MPSRSRQGADRDMTAILKHGDQLVVHVLVETSNTENRRRADTLFEAALEAAGLPPIEPAGRRLQRGGKASREKDKSRDEKKVDEKERWKAARGKCDTIDAREAAARPARRRVCPATCNFVSGGAGQDTSGCEEVCGPNAYCDARPDKLPARLLGT